MDRRTVIAAAACAIGLGAGGRAAAAPADDVAAAAERLRQTMLRVDPAALDEIFADGLSYGHSDGRVETKAQTVAALVEKRSVFNAIEIGNQTVLVSGDVAVVRHRFVADVISGGKPGKPNIAVVQVWQNQGGRWRLLVRQAHV